MDSTRQGIQISEQKMANMAAALRAFSFFLFFLLAFTTTTRTTVVSATTFWVENRCSYTVWAAATPVGGGRELRTGQQWSFTAAAGTTLGRIWPRTGCHFDSSGRGSCETGDCGGLLQCSGWGKLPATLAEYALKQYNDLDFYDISLVDGFNVPLSITPTSACKKVSCNKDINAVCPSELKVQGGCDSACTKFGSPQYCCTGAYLNNCPATSYSRFFKNLCPQAYSYARDDATSTFTCPFGTDYRVVFCDTSSSSSSSSISVSSIQSESQSESETESRLVSQV